MNRQNKPGKIANSMSQAIKSAPKNPTGQKTDDNSGYGKRDKVATRIDKDKSGTKTRYYPYET